MIVVHPLRPLAVPAATLVARTWRFRDVGRVERPPTLPREPAILAVWHEFLFALLPLATRIPGIVSVVSGHSDGELAGRALDERGGLTIPSQWTGARQLRALVRAARAGHTLVLTPDGPEGPRRVCAGSGIFAAAALSDRPIVPVGIAATPGGRVDSWDRHLVPAPGARLYVSFGDPIPIPRRTVRDPAARDALAGAIGREVGRCEAVAADAAWGRPLGVRAPADAWPERRVPASGRRSGTGRVERFVRAAWVAPSAPAWLRPVAGLYSAATRVRNTAYDAGLIAGRAVSIPVVSVGGITVGGSGKTPVAAEIAAGLRERGHAPATLTRGYRDELRLHASLGGAAVWGHPDRVRLARRAAAAGATVAILDDGFQHRRLRRDLDILLLDRDALRRTHGSPLPAGPFRETVEAASRRADVVILTGREAWGAALATFDDGVRERLTSRRSDLVVAALTIEPGPLEPANDMASGRGSDAEPAVALTGVMKPRLFFEAVRSRTDSVVYEHAVPDHGHPAPEAWPDLLARAAAGGLVVTKKDLARWPMLGEASVPVWVLPDLLRWRSGRSAVWERIEAAVGGARAERLR